MTNKNTNNAQNKKRFRQSFLLGILTYALMPKCPQCGMPHMPMWSPWMWGYHPYDARNERYW